MVKMSAIGSLAVTDLNDALVTGTAPTNPTDGTLWLDTSVNPPVLKIWKNEQWQDQPIDISSLDPDMATVIENITVTIGNMANDNVLDFNDRTVIVDNLMEIIGKIMSATDTALPTVDALDKGQKGNFYQVRKNALNAGVLVTSANYIGVATTYTALGTYLGEMTPIRPWDISDNNKDKMLTIVKATFRQKWLDYYLAVQKLAEETSNKLKENMDNIGTEVSSVKSEISTLNDQIALRVTKTELTDALTPYPTKTEVTSEIKVTTDGIKNSVTKEIEDKVSGVKTELETLIEQTEDKIELTVSGISQSGGNIIPSANFGDQSQWTFGGTIGNGEFKLTDEMQLGGTRTLKIKTGETTATAFASTPYLPESALKLIGKEVTISTYIYIPSGQAKLPTYIYADFCGYPDAATTTNDYSIRCQVSSADFVYDKWVRYSATGKIPASNSIGNIQQHKFLLGVNNLESKVGDFTMYYARPQVEVSGQLTPWNMGDVASQTQITQLSDKVIIDVNNAKNEVKDYTDDKVDSVTTYEMYSNSVDFGDYNYSGNPNLMLNMDYSKLSSNLNIIEPPNASQVIDKGDYFEIDITDLAEGGSATVWIPYITRLITNQTYNFSVEMKAETSTFTDIKIRPVYHNDKQIVSALFDTISNTATDTWMRYDKTFTPTLSVMQDSNLRAFQIYLPPSATRGKLHIRYNIKIEKGDKATPYQPNLLDTPYYLSKKPTTENIANNTVEFPIKTTDYKVYGASNAENWQLGQTYTLTLKGTKPSTQTFNGYLNSGTVGIGAMIPIEGRTDEWQKTFTVTQAQIDLGITDILSIYQVPKETSGEVQIEWLKLEKGDSATPNIDTYKYKGIGVKDSLNPKDYVWSDNPEYITKNTITNDNYYKDKDEIFNEIGNKVDNMDFSNLMDFAEQLQDSYEKFKSDEYLGDLQSLRDYIDGLVVDLGNKAVLFDFLNSYIKFTDEGILMEFNPPNSDESATMSMLLSTDRLSFFDGGKEVAYFSNQAFFINRGAIVESMQIGSHKISKLNEDHTVFQFVGSLSELEGGE